MKQFSDRKTKWRHWRVINKWVNVIRNLPYLGQTSRLYANEEASLYGEVKTTGSEVVRQHWYSEYGRQHWGEMSQWWTPLTLSNIFMSPWERGDGGEGKDWQSRNWIIFNHRPIPPLLLLRFLEQSGQFVSKCQIPHNIIWQFFLLRLWEKRCQILPQIGSSWPQ